MGARRQRSLGLMMVVALTACVDPAGRFDDFTARVVDAMPIDQPDAPPREELPDISGRFLVSMSAIAVSPAAKFQFIGQVTLNRTLREVKIELLPLDQETRLPVMGTRDATRFVPVSLTGEFEMPLNGTIPAEASVLPGLAFSVEGHMLGRLRTEDLFCGRLVGMVTAPVPSKLEPNTFAAIRVADDVMGDALPPPVVACPTNVPDHAGP